MSTTAKLFMHGRSQAVRLPKEFRFEGTEVRVSKVGDKVILEPLARTEEEIAAVWAKIDALRNGGDLFSDNALDDQPAEPDSRKFFD
jgi:antitoxin VapB